MEWKPYKDCAEWIDEFSSPTTPLTPKYFNHLLFLSTSTPNNDFNIQSLLSLANKFANTPTLLTKNDPVLIATSIRKFSKRFIVSKSGLELTLIGEFYKIVVWECDFRAVYVENIPVVYDLLNVENDIGEVFQRNGICEQWRVAVWELSAEYFLNSKIAVVVFDKAFDEAGLGRVVELLRLLKFKSLKLTDWISRMQQYNQLSHSRHISIKTNKIQTSLDLSANKSATDPRLMLNPNILKFENPHIETSRGIIKQLFGNFTIHPVEFVLYNSGDTYGYIILHTHQDTQNILSFCKSQKLIQSHAKCLGILQSSYHPGQKRQRPPMYIKVYKVFDLAELEFVWNSFLRWIGVRDGVVDESEVDKKHLFDFGDGGSEDVEVEDGKDEFAGDRGSDEKRVKVMPSISSVHIRFDDSDDE